MLIIFQKLLFVTYNLLAVLSSKLITFLYYTILIILWHCVHK